MTNEPGATPPPAPPEEAPPPPPTPPTPRRLLRSVSDRMITGLAGGMARHFDLDPTIVRVAFVVLALFNGLGVILYIVGSIIVPSEDDAAAEARGERTPRDYGEWGRVASIVFGLLLVGLGAGALLANVQGVRIDWVAVACGVLIAIGALLLLSAGRLARGPLVALGILLTIGLAPLTLADVSMGGSAFGDRVERPTSTADLARDYEHAFGSMTLDLRDVAFPEGTTQLRAGTAFGSLTVRVPRDIAVEVVAEAAFGSVQALGQEASGGLGVNRTFRTADYDRASRRLSLEVESAFGSVEVLR